MVGLIIPVSTLLNWRLRFLSQGITSIDKISLEKFEVRSSGPSVGSLASTSFALRNLTTEPQRAQSFSKENNSNSLCNLCACGSVAKKKFEVAETSNFEPQTSNKFPAFLAVLAFVSSVLILVPFVLLRFASPGNSLRAKSQIQKLTSNTNKTNENANRIPCYENQIY